MYAIEICQVLHYTMIYNYTVKCYQHRNPIIDNIFLRSLIFLRKGFAFGTNIHGYQFSNEFEINSLVSIPNGQ